MGKTNKPGGGEIGGVQYRRSKTWQIALGQMNAGYGVATATAGFILTATRIFDGEDSV